MNSRQASGASIPTGYWRRGYKSVRAMTLAILGSTLILLSSGCSTVTETVKGVFVDERFPQLPTPEIATYVVDLSGSTYPVKQLSALGSGIEEFVSGKSLGDPFASPKVSPKSLSIQFITANSANAPRVTLVSAKTGLDLYKWVEARTPNLDQAKPLWRGFVEARSQLSQSGNLDVSICAQQAIKLFGQQGLSESVLAEPARIICSDIQRTRTSLDQLQDFVTDPNVPLGSDVFGALDLAVSNLQRAEMQFPFASKTLVFASDMIDSTPRRNFNGQLRRIDSQNKACELAKEDLVKSYGNAFPLQDITVVLVGQGNSKANIALIEKVRKYWSCYFTSAGADLIETSDLNNY
jgi:hypothetical protein